MTKRPNILWYCTDQQRFDTLGALNNPYIQTPRLDQFMREAVTFDYAFCQSPICTPSRASFLTGFYPSTLGVNGNGNTVFPRHNETRLATHLLAKQGYDCGLVGKLHLASPALGVEQRVDDGYGYFQYSHDHKAPKAVGHDFAEWLRAQGADPVALMDEHSPQTYQQGAKVKSFGGVYVPTAEYDNIPPHLHQTYWCTEKAIEFIQKNRHENQPWLLSVNPFDPHAPFDPPYEYFRRYDPARLPGPHFQPSDLQMQQRLAAAGIDFQSQPLPPDDWNAPLIKAAYYAMIEQVDTEFGRLLDFLEVSGERENTIVVFMSDHGEMLCDHGLLLKGCRFYEGLVRVPLMISWRGHFEAGVISEALIELLDLAPTFYELAGMEIPDQVQGRSLAGLLLGEKPLHKHREFVRTEFFGAINYPDQTHATMYRDHRWKLISYHHKGLFELYDLENDPWEHHDLSDDPAHQAIKWELVRRSFDATVYAHFPDPPRTLPF